MPATDPLQLMDPRGAPSLHRDSRTPTPRSIDTDAPMTPSQPVPSSLPITELADASGPVAAQRGPRVGDPDLRALMQGTRQVQFVVADGAGVPLRWIPLAETRAFWRYEVKPRIVLADAVRFEPDVYPGRYCYVATQWTREPPDAVPLVLLERYQ